MISYFILTKSGSIIYQSVNDGKLDGSDSGHIRYLPLLLIKDLIKVNLHDQIHHVNSSGKLAAFWERHNLLFIACTKQERIPLAVLHKHLFIIDNYLRFSFGPQWQLRFHNTITTPHSRRALYPTITADHLTTCLAQLPFIGSSQIPRSYHCLCLVEQIDLQEELNSRLSETLRDCCDSSFPHLPTPPTATKSATNKLSNFFTSTPRLPSPTTTLSAGHQRYQDNQQQQQQHSVEAGRSFGTWNHAFLFAREKVVIHCSNRNQHQQSPPPITDDLLYYLKMMVTDYICENMDYESSDRATHLKQQQDASAPQTILRTNTAENGNNENISPSTSSPTLCTSTSTNDTPNQKSPSFSYVYDSNATTPFKIQMKSTVTEVSPSTTTIPHVSWSNPPPLIHSHLLSRLPKESLHDGSITRTTSHTTMREIDDDLLHEMTAAMKVTSLTPSLDHHYQHHQYEADTPLPPNAKALYQKYHQHQQQQTMLSSPTSPLTSFSTTPTKDIPYLSSSVPSSSTTNTNTTNIPKSDTYHHTRQRHNSEDGYASGATPIVRQNSANILPLGRPLRQQQHPFSTKHGSSNDPSDDSSNQDNHSYHQQKQKQRQPQHHGTIKTVRRWLKHGNRVISTRVCLALASDGLVVVLLFSDEMLPIDSASTSSSRSTKQQQQQHYHHHHYHHHHHHHQIKQFTLALRTALYDFVSFLLTKERAHFTILSFASTYPGLVHFIHIKKGVVFAPQLVDLNDMDKHHEILHEIFCTYAVQPVTSQTTVIGKWRWPTVTRLKKLCADMLSTGLSSRSPSIRSIQEPTRHRQGFHVMYLSGRQQQQFANVDPGDELLAIYFSFVPKDKIWTMQHQLLSDVSQRHFMK